jgi:catechol 2,3-dioxygenase-like lactoylglutathione lyase family enzyme
MYRYLRTCSISCGDVSVPNLRSVELKVHVPSKDFAVAKRFYSDLGFTRVWSTEALAYFRHGACRFLLQDGYLQAHAENFQMHMMVENVDDWWDHVVAMELSRPYSVKAEPPEDRPWGLRDFVLFDPSGVLWRIAQPLAQAG